MKVIKEKTKETESKSNELKKKISEFFKNNKKFLNLLNKKK